MPHIIRSPRRAPRTPLNAFSPSAVSLFTGSVFRASVPSPPSLTHALVHSLTLPSVPQLMCFTFGASCACRPPEPFSPARQQILNDALEAEAVPVVWQTWPHQALQCCPSLPILVSLTDPEFHTALSSSHSLTHPPPPHCFLHPPS
jgi:hypothetical protein